MRYPFIAFLCFALLFVSCEDKKTTTDEKILPSSILTSSTGGVDEVMFVFGNTALTDANKEMVDNYFLEAYGLLPQVEQRFTLSKIKYNQLNDILFRFRNTVFVSSLDATDDFGVFAQQLLTDEEIEQAKSGEKNVFFKQNMWSAPQMITVVLAESKAGIDNLLAQESDLIKDVISLSEIKAYKDLAYIKGVNQVLNKQFDEYHQLQWDVPADYQLVRNEGNFIWLRKDDEKSVINLFFDVEYYNETPAIQNLGIEKRNSLGGHVESSIEEAYMVTDETLGTIAQKISNDNDWVTFQNQGLWRMENDFFGGPFINQYIIDEKNDRAIYIEGFVFGPDEKNKRKLMRQFEAIFSTLKEV